MKSILTERLDLTPLKESDAQDLFELHSDPEVMKYIGPTLTNINEAKSRIAKVLKYSAENDGFGIWAARLEETEEFIGWCVLCHIELNPENPIEVGYRIHQKFWNKGYATEMGKVLKEYAKIKLKIENIVGITHPDNIGSCKVLEKIGLSYKEDRTYYDLPCKFYC
jgi:ribosomal-protein-alanine N-acetyltransferase